MDENGRKFAGRRPIRKEHIYVRSVDFFYLEKCAIFILYHTFFYNTKSFPHSWPRTTGNSTQLNIKIQKPS